MAAKELISSYGIENLGITNTGKVHWNYNTAELYEDIIRNNEGFLAHLGPIVVRTGSHTGRAANDKLVVEETGSKDSVWWGKVNKPYAEEQFNLLLRHMQSYLQGKELYVQDCFVCYDPKFRVPIRIITETAWHNLFARNMFITGEREQLVNHIPDFTVIHAPNFKANPKIDGTVSETFIIVNLTRKLVLIGGTSYAGEIKKSIFTMLNYVLPKKNILSMHCSANVGHDNDVALFFGLSGTGKTTLSADPNRKLIGDDEHGWSSDGVFNFEGGCYAKVINLSSESEPEIYATTRLFGTIIENVGVDKATRRLDLYDAEITENTRAAYPLSYIPNALKESMGGHPKNIIMLTADAFGVMPPISKLTPEQAMYHFISGYTAKVAGTEAGITEPQATFSACFGAPFMVLHPACYATLLAENIRKHNVTCWLVNTGWTGGRYGVGKRMKIEYTRTLLNKALDGSLNNVEFEKDPVFGIQVPKSCPGIPDKILKPRETWTDKNEFDQQAQHLAQLFVENFKEFEDKASDDVKAAAPQVLV